MIAPTLAMHMANELLNVPVAAVTLAVAAIALAASAAHARRTLDVEKLPLMGVMGAFVFAAQMINFTLPGMPGTSGHLGGGVLLAILLGPSAAIVTIASVLIVQCLIFQDGGLLALGCNIINMGLVPCLLGWVVYRGALGRTGRAPAWRQYAAAWAACVVAIAVGAALVPLQASVAGRLSIPTTHFLVVMVGVHLIIGAIEGLITFAVVAYLRRVRPATLGLASPGAPAALSRRAVAASLVATALLFAGVVSLFASSHPDGLEWSYLEHKYGQEEAVKPAAETIAAVDDFQSRYSLMPDYTKRPADLGKLPTEADAEAEAAEGWGSFAGVVGTAATLLLVYGLSVLLRKKGKADGQAAPAG